jgi:hypothetical protein
METTINEKCKTCKLTHCLTSRYGNINNCKNFQLKDSLKTEEQIKQDMIALIEDVTDLCDDFDADSCIYIITQFALKEWHFTVNDNDIELYVTHKEIYDDNTITERFNYTEAGIKLLRHWIKFINQIIKLKNSRGI